MNFNEAFRHALIQKHQTFCMRYQDDAANLQVAYEQAYFYEYGCLPPDTFVIERVERVGRSYIFIHRILEIQQ